MKYIVPWLIIAVSFLLQGVLVSMPLVVSSLLVLYVLHKSSFFAAFIIGILLDIFLVRAIGTTSLFLVTFLFIITLYAHKFEVQTVPFIASATFLGSVAFLLLFNGSFVILQALINVIFAVALFVLLQARSTHTKEAL